MNRFLPLPNRSLVAACAILCYATTVPAVELTFTIDPSQSLITMEDSIVNALGVSLTPQAPGAFVTSASGTIVIDVDDVNAPTALEFTGGVLGFDNNGDWLPEIGGGGPGVPGTAEPGSYGAEFINEGLGVTIYSVFRNLTASFAMYDESHFGDPITPDPIPVSGGSIPWDDENSRVIFDLLGGAWDWNLGGSFGDDGGTSDVDEADNLNIATANGTYSVSGSIATLTIPFRARLGESPDGDPSALLSIFDGTFVATASLAPGFDEGDFDEDGDVDGDDFLAWQSGFGTTSGALKSDGDYDNDGDVDGDDFLGWQSEFGNGGGSGAVPEPSSIVLVVLAAVGIGFSALRKWRA